MRHDRTAETGLADARPADARSAVGGRDQAGARIRRVLHVVGRMDRGGVETWLMHVLRSSDPARFAFDFLVHAGAPGAFDAEIVRRGGRVIPLGATRRRVRYASQFHAAIRGHGPYDIVHSHVHHFSGVVVRAARAAGIRARIVHSHSDTSAEQAQAPLIRRVYLKVTEALIRRHGTLALAVSEKAGRALFAGAGDDPRCPWDVLHYGIDLDPFRTPPDRAAVRRELGIVSGALVVGHVGNLNRVKNHAFLIAVFAELLRQRPDAVLLLMGEGPLRPALEALVAAQGFADRVKFLGVRPDVPRLLAGAVDVFIFPSLWEGLPLAMIEAQAAGLPILVSDCVSGEVDILPSGVHRLRLDAGPAHWASTCLRVCHERMAPERAYRYVADSDMNIARSVASLQQLYERAMRAGEHVAGSPEIGH